MSGEPIDLPGQTYFFETLPEPTPKPKAKPKNGSSYPGGKASVVRHLINEIPPHQVYFAGTAGHDAVARFKLPARINILCELDPGVVSLWNANPHVLGSGRALDDTVAPCHACQQANNLLPHSPECCLTKVGHGPVDLHIWQACGVDAIEMLCGLKGHSVRFGEGAAKPWLPAAAMLAHTTGSTHPRPTDWFAYFDPPYPWAVRSGRVNYGEHEWADEDHERFLAVMLRLPCNVMVSSYSAAIDGTANALYIDTFKREGWRRIEYETRDRGGNKRLESAWMNYPARDALHDYSWLGDDFREREKIKRLEQRHIEQLNAMPAQRRLALLQRLAHEFG